jgi:hypothetical protein
VSLAARWREPWLHFGGRAPREVEAEIEAEIEFHLAEAELEARSQGLDPLAARARAVEQFGDVQHIRAECRRAQLGGRDMLVKVLVGVIAALVLTVLGMGAMLWTMRARALDAMQMAISEREAAMHAEARAREALERALEAGPAQPEAETQPVDPRQDR